MPRRLIIWALIISLFSVLLFPIALTELKYSQLNYSKLPFKHSTPVKIGFGERAKQEFPFFHAAAINYRRLTPPSQSKSAYTKWQNDNPKLARQINEYQSFLDKNGVGDVIEMRQLLFGCASNPMRQDLAFNVPPRQTWANIVPTLRYFRDEVRPTIGAVRLYHGYRNPEANKECHSRSNVHPANSAIDFVPLEINDPTEIERKMCNIFKKSGGRARVGMGFYGVGLIHIDTRGFRSWGPDTRSRTSPCRIN